MSSLRALGLSYLATASLFSLAIAFSDHAALRLVTQESLRALSDNFQARVVGPVMQFARIQDERIFDPQVVVPLSPPGPNDARPLDTRTTAHVDMPSMPQHAIVAPQITIPEPVIIAPDLPDMGTSEMGAGYGGSAPPPLPKFVEPQTSQLAMPVIPMQKLAPPPKGPDASALSPAERAAVTARLEETLSPEMKANFDLVLYVSKSKKGPLAQRLYVFKKDSKGALNLAHDWAASTGREEYEVSPRGAHTRTNTPAGFYQLDPVRMYRKYHSYSWDQPMPYAIFFNWESEGNQTGLAIHSATGDDIPKLGQRASAGCVHIAPDNARQLYEMIRADYKGAAPRFAYDTRTQTMHKDGQLMRDPKGNLVMAQGYKVLVDIEDFSGANMLATLD